MAEGTTTGKKSIFKSPVFWIVAAVVIAGTVTLILYLRKQKKKKKLKEQTPPLGQQAPWQTAQGAGGGAGGAGNYSAPMTYTPATNTPVQQSTTGGIPTTNTSNQGAPTPGTPGTAPTGPTIISPASQQYYQPLPPTVPPAGPMGPATIGVTNTVPYKPPINRVRAAMAMAQPAYQQFSQQAPVYKMPLNPAVNPGGFAPLPTP
jgi:hypothetical protein